MTPIQETVQAVLAFARQAISAYGDFPGSDRELLQSVPCRSVLESCKPLPFAQRSAVLGQLAPAISSSPDAFQASRLAMLCGILVEWGADPAVAAAAIIKRLPEQLKSAATIASTVNTNNEAATFSEAPDAVKSWKGLRYIAMAAMTVLSLDIKLRHAARQQAGLIDGVKQLAGAHREVKFLQRLLELADGDELIVLHPLAVKGYRVRLEAIASNFHLFTLLQAAIIGDPATGLVEGPRASRMVLGTATGEIPHDRLVSDEAVFHYATWEALLPDGVLAAAPSSTWILGEAMPRDIPVFELERVVLVGPPVLGARSWDSTFFTNLHDALRSKVEIVEIMSRGEVQQRLRRIGGATRTPCDSR